MNPSEFCSHCLDKCRLSQEAIGYPLPECLSEITCHHLFIFRMHPFMNTTYKSPGQDSTNQHTVYLQSTVYSKQPNETEPSILPILYYTILPILYYTILPILYYIILHIQSSPNSPHHIPPSISFSFLSRSFSRFLFFSFRI